MNLPFLIRGPEGQQYELSSVDAFLDEYEAKGFVIVENPPHSYGVPDLKAAKAERKEATKPKAAKAETKPDTTKDAKA